MNDGDVSLEFLKVVHETGYCVEKVGCDAVVAWRCLQQRAVDYGKRMMIDVFIWLRECEACEVLIVHAGWFLV